MTTLDFVKYHGLGNDFVLVDNRAQADLLLTPDQVIAVCDRRRGVGADGVIFLKAAPRNDLHGEMVILNSDGSTAQMCGNGIRCLAYFMRSLGMADQAGAYRIWTGAGMIIPEFRAGGLIQVDMGLPRLTAQAIPTTLAEPESQVIEVPIMDALRVTAVSMGNPHAVIFVDEFPDHWASLGATLEHHPSFPERTNVHFVKVIDHHTLDVKVWERGAGATLACGTGACAVLVAAILTGRAKSPAQVHLPGGPLTITWAGGTVLMEGPATKSFQGIFPLSVRAGMPSHSGIG